MKNSKAHFVYIDDENRERFKYLKKVCNYIETIRLFQNIKNFTIKKIQRVKFLLGFVKWKDVRNDFVSYIIEASIDGIAINFVLHFVFGMRFTILTAIAYGIGYNQIISFYWRLKNNGSNSKILNKDKYQKWE